jgi:hypothetical protein
MAVTEKRGGEAARGELALHPSQPKNKIRVSAAAEYWAKTNPPHIKKMGNPHTVRRMTLPFRR